MSKPSPHSPGWFEKLKRINPQQAAHTARIIELAGRLDVCTICGDEDSRVYQPVDAEALPLRLCQDCLHMQKQMYGLSVDPVP